MGLLKKLGGLAGRTSAAVTSGGATEFTGYGDDIQGAIEDASLNGIGDALGLTPVDRAQLDQDRARSRELQERFLGELDRPAYAPQTVTTEDAQSTDAQAAPDVQLRDPGAVEHVQARDITAPGFVEFNPNSVQQVQAGNATAERVGAINMGGAATAQVGGVDPLATDLRGRQVGFLNQMEVAARGEGPSVAKGLLNTASQNVVDQAKGQAATARGTQRASARRQGLYTAADGLRKAGMDAATVGAQEQIAARSQLGSSLTDVRGSDQALALQKAGMATDVNKYNAGEINTQNRAQGQLDAGIATGNASRTTDVNVGNVNRTADVATGNAGRVLSGEQLRTGVMAGNIERTVGVETGNANRNLTGQTTNTDAANGRGNLTMTTGATVDAGNANRRTDVNVGNAARTTTTATGNLDRRVDVQGKNQDAGVTSNGQEIQRQSGLRGSTVNANAQAGNATATGLNVQAKDKERRAAMTTNVGTGITQISDRRKKEFIHKLDDNESDDFLEALEQYAYRYKDGGEAGAAPGQRYGIMAQNLEKSKMGASIVDEGPDGSKHINVPQSIGVMMAALGRMEEKIKAKQAKGKR